MTKVTMPEPVACLWLKDGVAVNAFNHPPGDRKVWDHDGYWAEKGYDKVPLITTEQAEAYAATKVREALGEAAQACETRIGTGSPGIDTSDCDVEATECAAAIRALTPS